MQYPVMDYTLASDLDVVAAIPWTQSKKATPIQDMLNVRHVARLRYGMALELTQMSEETARLVVATYEFQCHAKAAMCPAPNVDNPPSAEFYFQHFTDFLLRITAPMLSGVTGLYARDFDNRIPLGLVTLAPMDGTIRMQIARIHGVTPPAR